MGNQPDRQALAEGIRWGYQNRVTRLRGYRRWVMGWTRLKERSEQTDRVERTKWLGTSIARSEEYGFPHGRPNVIIPETGMGAKADNVGRQRRQTLHASMRSVSVRTCLGLDSANVGRHYAKASAVRA